MLKGYKVEKVILLCRNYPEALNLNFDECIMVCDLVYKVITFQQRKQRQILTKQISREKKCILLNQIVDIIA